MAAAAPLQRPIVPVVVQQHAEEAALLRHVRSVLVRAPHVQLLRLARLDERIAAHLDGLAVAGAAGTALLKAALERPGAGEVFALGVRALETRDAALLDHLLALVPELPDAERGLASALGWVSAAELQGLVRPLLASPRAHARALGLAACRMHRVDPGPTLADALTDPAPMLRTQALRAAGALGRLDLLPAVRQCMSDEAPEVVFWAAWAACLLGDRRASLQVLAAAARQTTPLAPIALGLVLWASTREDAVAFVAELSAAAQAQPDDVGARRRLIRAFGMLGEPRFVPWLIDRMAEPASMRLAGESFSWITGADLAALDLETLDAPPLPATPSEDPDDDVVALDEDESLPWPAPERVRAWWERHQPALHAHAASARLFAGEALQADVLQRVLHEGTQRQRAQAALGLCLLQPGHVLFPVAAPVPRQRRWLAEGRY